MSQPPPSPSSPSPSPSPPSPPPPPSSRPQQQQAIHTATTTCTNTRQHDLVHHDLAQHALVQHNLVPHDLVQHDLLHHVHHAHMQHAHVNHGDVHREGQAGFGSGAAPTTTLAHLVATAKTENADAMIRNVYDQAAAQYRLVKRRKQDELRQTVTRAEHLGDRAIVKNQKKKVDNHASAVASRVKQDFLVRRFDDLVRHKMAHNAHLANTLVSLSTSLAAKDEQMRRLVRSNAALALQLSATAHLPAHRTHIPTTTTASTIASTIASTSSSPTAAVVTAAAAAAAAAATAAFEPFADGRSHVGDDVWPAAARPCHEADTLGAFVHVHEYSAQAQSVVASCALQDDEGYVEDSLEQLLERVRTQMSCADGGAKLEPSPWDSLQTSIISDRQVSVRAQLRADEADCNDPYINPVA